MSKIMRTLCWTVLNRYKQHRRQDLRQVNEAIRFHRLRVVSDNGQLGVMSKNDALALAEKQQKDLVVINQSGDVPIAKILDANKYFYEQKRKEKETAKKQRENQIVVK